MMEDPVIQDDLRNLGFDQRTKISRIFRGALATMGQLDSADTIMASEQEMLREMGRITPEDTSVIQHAWSHAFKERAAIVKAQKEGPEATV